MKYNTDINLNKNVLNKITNCYYNTVKYNKFISEQKQMNL